MKLFWGLLLCAAPLNAQIYADVSTTLGDFTVELYYEDSPKTVANFMTLAEGTRAWIDPATGIVRKNTPYFDGIIFHRVIEGFMNQVGSPQGTGADGPGYNFPDEVDNGVIHDAPYLLSSANSGPNTNGSQMFITVGATPWLDGIHTVFGKVTTGTTTIDTINQVPVNGSRPVNDVSITSIAIRKEGAEATAFDPLAQGLPEVIQLKNSVVQKVDQETRVVSTFVSAEQPAGSTLILHSSSNLNTWTGTERHLDATRGALNQFEIDPTLFTRQFYRAALVNWPAEAAFPSHLKTSVITINSNVGDFILRLGDDPATMAFTGVEGGPHLINEAQTTIDTDGYGATLLIYTNNLIPIRFRLGADLPIGILPTGRMSGTAFNANNTSLNGTFTFSNP
ncbi:MAG: peptidylprolyl isomerase [Akkermansiaceae bacterium]